MVLSSQIFISSQTHCAPLMCAQKGAVAFPDLRRCVQQTTPRVVRRTWRLPFQIVTRSEKNVVYVTVRRFPALPLAIRHPAQPRRCTWLTLSRVTHQRARQPHPVCCSSQSSGPDVNAVMDCGRSISRARHSRFTPINSRINDMVLYATIDWLEAAMTCATGGGWSSPVVHDSQQCRATR